MATVQRDSEGALVGRMTSTKVQKFFLPFWAFAALFRLPKSWEKS
jgi:hypothetical protein